MASASDRGGSTHYCLICHNPIADPAAECPYCRSRAAGGDASSTPLLTIAGAVLAMVALWVVTELATAEFRQTRHDRQQSHLSAAEAAFHDGDIERAAEEYREALEFGRFDFESRLGLASALVRLGQSSEAENHLLELRESDPTHALVNRLLGQIAAEEGDVEAAVSHYRTAIHGRWPAGAEERRLQARLDLVELLVAARERLPAVAELTAALDEAPENPSVRRRIGRLWLEAEAPTRAAEVFEDVLERNPDDAPALLGLGEAELARGRFLSARTAFNRAAAAGAAEAEVQRWLALCDTIIEVDPTYRRAGTRERLRRSQALASRALADLEQCLGRDAAPGEGPPPPSERSLAASARKRLAETAPPLQAEEAVDENIALAESLWDARVGLCPEVEGDAVTRLILEKLAQ